MTKVKNRKKTFKVNLPKTRYQKEQKSKVSFSAAEVDTIHVENDERRNEKDFKVYQNVKIYDTSLSRWRTETTLFEEGFSTIEEAIERVDEICN